MVEIIGADYSPMRERKVDRECERAVDLGEALVNALRRQAEAWEGREKWDEVGRDLGVVAGIVWVSVGAKNEVVRGAARCRQSQHSSHEAEARTPGSTIHLHS